ncbi:hypothetical protein [Priestia megaterium]|uniref:hypothetical protein n=1 Tax=Priestia megaterium TaxID=1404 RepID=UPI002040FE5E|nr:hypothetical protein [Priestia megaterium]MCM3196535.1 hypothetical protein [Priestia megaterium]
MSHWVTYAIIAIVLIAHNFLSTRANVYWGAIIPGAYLAFCGWLLFTGHQTDHPIKSTLLLLFGLLIFLIKWGVGRDTYKKKQEKELNKMKTQDI